MDFLVVGREIVYVHSMIIEEILNAGDDLTYSQLTQMLYRLRGGGVRYGIERMPPVLEALGNPQKKFPSVHVAGTNGKGSVCALLESCYRAAGQKTGLFVSPHLVKLGERVQVDRNILSEEALLRESVAMAKNLLSLVRENPDCHPSFFEWMTALGFQVFAREKVDLAFIETGLGGRLDATNVLDPVISVITSIGLDHCEILGSTYAEIAREKGGIIKAGRPVVLGLVPPEAEEVLREIAERHGSPVFSVREKWGERDDTLPPTLLRPAFQRRNAATLQLVHQVLKDTPHGISPKALDQGVEQFRWEARWTRMEKEGKHLVLDTTHNAEGARFLEESLAELVSRETLHTVVLGTTGEDRAEALLAAVLPYARELVLVAPDQPRAVPPPVLAGKIPKSYRGTVRCSTVEDEIDASGNPRCGNPGETILFTGSIYLIGEILSRLRGTVGEKQLQG
ncbi:MAG: bifunctional folylpolyglutamate synthase/dihydrofolate synthase [Opitutales bacterium]|nr:bifunctional folylpolyglutamate synthase/dihydrofolate synthase [Opitutales bacterium]